MRDIGANFLAASFEAVTLVKVSVDPSDSSLILAACYYCECHDYLTHGNNSKNPAKFGVNQIPSRSTLQDRANANNAYVIYSPGGACQWLRCCVRSDIMASTTYYVNG